MLDLEVPAGAHDLNLPLDHYTRVKRRARQIAVREGVTINLPHYRGRASSTGSSTGTPGSTHSSFSGLSTSDYSELPSDILIDRILEARRRKDVRRATTVLLRDARPEELAEVFKKSGTAAKELEKLEKRRSRADALTELGTGRSAEAGTQCCLGSGRLWARRRCVGLGSHACASACRCHTAQFARLLP
jgi:hypothetical protein